MAPSLRGHSAEDVHALLRETAAAVRSLLPDALAEAESGARVSMLLDALPTAHRDRIAGAKQACLAQVCRAAVRCADAAAEGTMEPDRVERSVVRPLSSMGTIQLHPRPVQKVLLIQALLACAVAAGLDSALIRSVLQRICILLQPRARPLRPSEVVSGLTVNHRLISACLERLWWRKCVLRKYYAQKTDFWFGRTCTRISAYFEEGAEEVVWQRYRPLLCPHFHVQMFKAWSSLLHLLPVRRVKQEWLAELIDLWGLNTDAVWGCEMLCFLQRFAEVEVLGGELGPVQSTIHPYADRIHGHVLKYIKIGRDCKDDSTFLLGKGSGANKKDTLMQCSGMLCSCLLRLGIRAGPEEAVKAKGRLRRLLETIDQFAARCSDRSDVFLAYFSRMLVTQMRDERCITGQGTPDDIELEVGSDEDTADAVGRPCDVAALLPDLADAAVELLLPHALNLLINQRDQFAARNGATVLGTLIPMCPGRTLGATITRARLTASIATSTVRHNPSLLEALLPSCLLHGTDEDLGWVLGRVSELIDPVHVKALQHATSMVMFVCACTPLTTDMLSEWGMKVWKKMLSVAETTDCPPSFPAAAQILLAALPPEQQAAACGMVTRLITSKLHSQLTKKNHMLRCVGVLCGCCGSTCPEWGIETAEALSASILDEKMTDVGEQWCAHLLSKLVWTLGPRLVPIAERVAGVVDRLLFGPKEDDWRLKEGGFVMKYLIRGLTRMSPLEWGPATPTPGRRVGFVNGPASKVRWHCPGKEEVQCAAGLMRRWAGPLLKRLREANASGTSWRGREADAVRLLYVTKSAHPFVRQEWLAAAEAPDDPFIVALRDEVVDEARASLAEVGLTARALADLLISAPLHSKQGCSERVGAALSKTHLWLMYDRRDIKYEKYLQAALEIRVQGGLLLSRRCMPRCVLVFGAANRRVGAFMRFTELRTRGPVERDLLVAQNALAATGPDRVRLLTGILNATLMHLHAFSKAQINDSLDMALNLIRRAPAAETGALEDEHAALAGLSIVNRFEVMAMIFRDWGLLKRLARTMLQVGYDSRAQLRSKVEAVFHTAFCSTRAVHTACIPKAVSADDYGEWLSSLVDVAEGERSRQEGQCESSDTDEEEVVRGQGTPPAMSPRLAAPQDEGPPGESGADVAVAIGGGRHAATKRAARLLGVLARACPVVEGPAVNSWIPQKVMLYFLHNLDHPLTSVRSSCREVLANLMVRHKQRVPRRLVLMPGRSTTSDLPTEVKEYDYAAPLPPPSPSLDAFAAIFTPEFIVRVLSFDEYNDYALQEALREERASFDWWTSQMWKAMFKVLGERLLSSFEAAEGISDPEFICKRSRQQAEVVGGLLRALRHWRRDDQADLVRRAWAFVLRRVRVVLDDGRLRASKDFEEALSFSGSRHESLQPLQDMLVEQLHGAATLQRQVRAVEIVLHFCRGLHRLPQHLEFANRVLHTLQTCGLKFEFQHVRRKVSVLNALLFQNVFRLPLQPHPELRDYLETTLAPDSAAAVKVVLGTVYSVASTGRVCSLEPYLGVFASALSFAARSRETHCDDGEMLNLLLHAVRCFVLRTYDRQGLRSLCDIVRGIDKESLVRKKGRSLVLQVVTVVAVNCVAAAGDEELEAGLREVLSGMLRSHMHEAAMDAAKCVSLIVRISDADALERWFSTFDGWAASERSLDRKAATTGYRGVLLSRTFSESPSMWRSLRALISLNADSAYDVRRVAAEAAVAWRRAVREHGCLWRSLEPTLDAKGLLKPLMSIESMSTAGFS
eukprot:TRINITY_DN4357_c0_g1_i6.p1 TRINITY_DN4357_c0_g1~~TRINITY_DN4357_c0_g1_i6.p1  ORF type:complete len:1786 (+),score=663.80 TRINITY_DN4357_c0_g1_i6:59-5359(+)